MALECRLRSRNIEGRKRHTTGGIRFGILTRMRVASDCHIRLSNYSSWTGVYCLQQNYRLDCNDWKFFSILLGGFDDFSRDLEVLCNKFAHGWQQPPGPPTPSPGLSYYQYYIWLLW
jgi:hypothetical protein